MRWSLLRRNRPCHVACGCPLVVLAGVLAVAVAAVAFVLTRADRAAPAESFVTRDGSRLMLDGKPFAVAGSNNYRPMFLEPPAGRRDHEDGGRQQPQGDAGVGLQRHRQPRRDELGRHGEHGRRTSTSGTATRPRTTTARTACSGSTTWSPRPSATTCAWSSRSSTTGPPSGAWTSTCAGPAARTTATSTPTPPSGSGTRTGSATSSSAPMCTPGVKYKDEPTIAVFELANEARCQGAGQYPRSPECTTDTITELGRPRWPRTSSRSTPDTCSASATRASCAMTNADHFAYDCSQGVDAAAIARLDDIDLVGMHLYPDHWETHRQWVMDYIHRHLALADEVGKPLFLGEFGWRGSQPRNAVFHRWMSAFHKGRRRHRPLLDHAAPQRGADPARSGRLHRVLPVAGLHAGELRVAGIRPRPDRLPTRGRRGLHACPGWRAGQGRRPRQRRVAVLAPRPHHRGPRPGRGWSAGRDHAAGRPAPKPSTAPSPTRRRRASPAPPGFPTPWVTLTVARATSPP